MDELDERIRKLAPRDDGVVGVIIDRDEMRALVTEMDRLAERAAFLAKQQTEWQQERTILLQHIARQVKE